ncbi:hypothetical protein, partial [Megasphaera massiliensis]|uniref:hypothetical protein n=1 Tax=Megasphaera massiliensis TaxID=1232428 RepID=UPI0034A13D93
MPFSAPVLTYRAKALASNMCSKVLNGHIILTDTSITTILAPEMTYTPLFLLFLQLFPQKAVGWPGTEKGPHSESAAPSLQTLQKLFSDQRNRTLDEIRQVLALE